MVADRPRVLLVNDDGPPGSESPHVFGLYQHLTNHLKWSVKVVIPSSQKSWIGQCDGVNVLEHDQLNLKRIGKAYHIKEVTRGRYFYPRMPDGTEGETSDTPRQPKEHEVAEWVLLDGTPATCTNVGLHNLYPGEIDLVISGPNFGRNTSAAFSLSSGTIGAAMSAALSGTPAIAISYGNVHHPTPLEFLEPAHNLSVRIVEYLWSNWGKGPNGTSDNEVDLYNVNLPMIHKLTEPQGLQVYWTRTWRNSYGRLFKHVRIVHEKELPMDDPDSLTSTSYAAETNYLAFKFAPDVQPLINPDMSTVPIGTDGWAFGMGHASVTPMRSGFAEVDVGGTGDPQKLVL